MRFHDPIEMFRGVVLVIAPHMDDEVLGCGGTIARLPNKDRVHCIYVSDGVGSPSPVIPWLDSVSPDISMIRMKEAEAALKILDVPSKNLHFLGFPGGRLGKFVEEIKSSLSQILRWLNPDHVFIPFRYDRHPDHLAVNRAANALLMNKLVDAELFEYFIYYRSRLLPEGDIRRYIRPNYLISVDIGPESARKRKALECFKSQTIKFYPWQIGPVLSSDLLDEFSQGPEIFFSSHGLPGGNGIFRTPPNWICLVQRFESILKEKKYQAQVILHRIAQLYEKKRF